MFCSKERLDEIRENRKQRGLHQDMMATVGTSLKKRYKKDWKPVNSMLFG